MTKDDPLERNLEALFSDAVVAHPDDVRTLPGSAHHREPSGAQSALVPTERIQHAEPKTRSRWVLGIVPIVLAIAVLARAIWPQEAQKPVADTPSLIKMVIGFAAGLPVTPGPTASATPPRTTVAARIPLRMPYGATDQLAASPQPAASPTATASPVITPAAPSGLEVVPVDATRFRLSWRDNSDDEAGFRIFRGETFVAVTRANSTTYISGDLDPGLYACFHVQAFNDNGRSSWTDWACATMPTRTSTPTSTATATPAPTSTDAPTATPVGHVPAAPSSARAIAVGATRVRLEWRDNASNETGFAIREGEAEVTVGPDTVSILFTGLMPETEYCYTINAFNYDGASNWVDEVCVVTPPLFVTALAFGSGNTFAVAWADYDNDGDLDLAVANDGEQNHLYVNQGGTFVQTEQFGAGRTWSLAWSDYNNDGYVDIAVGNGFGDAQNYLFTNNGRGGFVSVDQFGSASTSALAWVDYDDDGDLDLAVGNEWDQQNALFVNGGSGRFAQEPLFGSSVTRAVAWGDADNDGDPDLAVGNHGQNYLFINDGGAFQGRDAFGQAKTNALAWHDFDRDGDLDLAVGNDDGQQNALFINEGDGVFSELAQFGAGHTSSLAWGDYDNDGDPDLAVGNLWDQANLLFVNNGDGTFAPLEAFGAGNTAAVAWGDFDNDGDLDLAVGNRSSQQNVLYINQLTALASGSP